MITTPPGPSTPIASIAAIGLLVEDTLLMSLMTLVRLFAALLLGWTLVALGIGAIGGGSPPHPSPVSRPVEPLRFGTLPETGLGSEPVRPGRPGDGSERAASHAGRAISGRLSTVSPWQRFGRRRRSSAVG